MKSKVFNRLPTERTNPRSKTLDRLSLPRILHILNKENDLVASAVSRQSSAMACGVRLIVASLRAGGRLFFMGAGTSGRLGVMEAAECPPTFNTPPSLVQAVMAGGRSAVFHSKEGAEDKGWEAASFVRKKVRAGDVVVGIAASGITAFVRQGLQAARRKKARTILVTCHPQASSRLAHVVIRLSTGPEVIAGSTRLKAGSATKMVLNSLTVASMVRLGKVFGNRMVDLQPKSQKLKARAVGLISLLGRVTIKRAKKLLHETRGNAKTAILMARKNIPYPKAIHILKTARGFLHKALNE